MKKTILELQKEQYGQEIKRPTIQQDIYEDLADNNFWLYFNINYKKCKTAELASLLETLKIYESRVFETGDKDLFFEHLDKFLKISIAIKAELLSRKDNKKKK